MHKLLISALLVLSLTTYVTAKESNTVYPTMSLTDINGTKYTVQGTEQGLHIKGQENKVIFLEFFGHNCPPCLASIPHLINLQKKYPNKLSVMAIEVQGYTTQQLKDFAHSKAMNYIVASEETAQPLVNYIQQRAQWRGSIPFLVAMDTQGNVQFVQAGMLPEKTLEELVEQLSNKKSVAQPNTIEKNSTK